VAGFLDVESGGDHAPVGLVVEDLEHMEGLEDPPVVGEGLTEPGWVPVSGEHAYQIVGADFAGWERPGDTEHVAPVLGYPLEADLVAGQGVEGSVAGVPIGPPQAGVGEIGDAGGELVAADGEQGEDDVA
jgi:hypothetical protein